MAGTIMQPGGVLPRVVMAVLVVSATTVAPACGTSVKMDYLPYADVRTDPIINPTCLSDHVHTFFGAAVVPHPNTTYADLRAATGNSGNVEENKSLYWYPTVYSLEDNGVYVKDPVWFSSAYYAWNVGTARAFPNGFKMVASGANELAGYAAGCDGESPCTKTHCSPLSSFLPPTRCTELEISLVFPSCWNGVDIDSPDHMSHVAYTSGTGRIDGVCPATHPVRIPQIHLFTRLINYSGGRHFFSDGSDTFHADYFSGWNETFLQHVLDNCNNAGESSDPNFFCGNFLTFRDEAGPKPDEKKEDTKIKSDLLPLQPPQVDTTQITLEAVNNINSLPRGACNNEGNGTTVHPPGEPGDGPGGGPGGGTSPPTGSSAAPTTASLLLATGSLLAAFLW